MKNDPGLPATILLVDDNTHGLMARGMILREMGHTVFTAQSAEEGWEIFRAHAFDLVVTDFRMGQMNGLELIRLIRASGSPARVILLTGFVNCLGVSEADTGADEVIAKSNKEVQELLRAVRRLAHAPPRRKPGSVRKSSAAKSGRA